MGSSSDHLQPDKQDQTQTSDQAQTHTGDTEKVLLCAVRPAVKVGSCWQESVSRVTARAGKKKEEQRKEKAKAL